MQLVDLLLSFHSNWFNHLIWMYLNQNIFHRSYPLRTVNPTIRPPQKYKHTTTPEIRPPNHMTTPEIQPYDHPRNTTIQPPQKCNQPTNNITTCLSRSKLLFNCTCISDSSMYISCMYMAMNYAILLWVMKLKICKHVLSTGNWSNGVTYIIVCFSFL